MRIQTVIKRMMLEPCGKSLVDSGMAFGYAYEKRKERDLDKEPVARLEWEITTDGVLRGIITKSMYHHLCEHLKYEAGLTDRLNKFFRRRGKEPCVDTDTFEEFVKTLRGYELLGSDNTYNHDSVLDGCFCYTHFEDDDCRSYFVLCTHNGCDPRWGYSSPKVFSCDDSYFFLLHYSYLFCKAGCMESEMSTDSTCFEFYPGEWSEKFEPGKYLFKDDKIHCSECGTEMELTVC